MRSQCLLCTTMVAGLMVPRGALSRRSTPCTHPSLVPEGQRRSAKKYVGPLETRVMKLKEWASGLVSDDEPKVKVWPSPKRLSADQPPWRSGSSQDLRGPRQLACDLLTALPTWILSEPAEVDAGRDLSAGLFGLQRFENRRGRGLGRFSVHDCTDSVLPSPRMFVLWHLLVDSNVFSTEDLDWETRRIHSLDADPGHRPAPSSTRPTRSRRQTRAVGDEVDLGTARRARRLSKHQVDLNNPYMPENASLEPCSRGKSCFFRQDMTVRIVRLIVSGRMVENILGVTLVKPTDWRSMVDKVPQLKAFSMHNPGLLPVSDEDVLRYMESGNGTLHGDDNFGGSDIIVAAQAEQFGKPRVA